MISEDILQGIRDKVQFLIEGEPSPDDEIEARTYLIDKFKLLYNDDGYSDQTQLIEDILEKLENWDTLDLWFKEVTELNESISKLFSLNQISQVVGGSEISIDKESYSKESPKPIDSDINQILSQVTEQFRGEIDSLKDTIETLKSELMLKEEKIKAISENKSNKEENKKEEILETETASQELELKESANKEITPAKSKKGKSSKLQPPKIRIPHIKKPDKVPTIKVHLDQQAEDISEIQEEVIEDQDEIAEIQSEMVSDLKEDISEVQEELMEDQEEIAELKKDSTSLQEKMPDLPPPDKISKAQTVAQETMEELKKMLHNPEEIVSKKRGKDGPRLIPIIKEESVRKQSSEIPFEVDDEDIEKDSIALTPLPVEKPKVLIKEDKKDESDLTPIPQKSSNIIKNLEPKRIGVDIDFEEPSLTPIPIRNTEKIKDKTDNLESIPINKEETKITPFSNIKPRITPINVEEMDEIPLKSTSTDLFNVFSSVGTKAFQKAPTPNKSIMNAVKKEGQKSTEMPKKPIELSVRPQLKSNPLQTKHPTDIKEKSLPKEKDSLYQELIALEGRRYSLEKAYKELSKNFELGRIDDFEFTNQSDNLRKNLDQISNQIKKIRATISTL